MSRRLLVVLVVLGVLAMGGGVAGGLLLTRDPGGDPAVAGPTTIPETTAPPTSEPAASTSSTSTSSSTTSTTAGLSLQARVAERLEDGIVVRYQASEPVSAVLQWGLGAPSGNQLRFAGPAAEGSVKLPLTRSTQPVSMQVTGQSADGRTGTSGTLSARRLVRRVVLEVQELTLDIPNGTGGIATTFRGAVVTPLGPGLRGPQARAQPYAFPSAVLNAGERPGPLSLRFFHTVQPNPPRTQVVTLGIPSGQPGQTTLNRDVAAIGLTAHLRLRLTVTVS